ncbi:MAG: cytochrome c [Burkholderiales bacterium]|nr:cytochrome c [Burkholderiales bacterium]
MKSMFNRTAVAILVCAPLVAFTGAQALADDGDLPPFPKDVLTDPAAIKAGHETFDKICKFCHGKSAYPGKAPKLNPKRYTPEFVFDRVTNGFRGMASYKEALSEQERQAVTAFIMSKEFSN